MFFSCFVNVLIPVTYKCPFAGDLYICAHCLSFYVSFKTWYETHKEIAWNRFTRKNIASCNGISFVWKSSVLVDRTVHPTPHNTHTPTLLYHLTRVIYFSALSLTLLTPNHQRISKHFLLLFNDLSFKWHNYSKDQLILCNMT